MARDRAARTCPRAFFCSQEPLAAQIYCLQIEILVDTHEQLQTPLGMPGTRQLLHLVKQRATGHGPQALMVLLPSSSSWRFSIYYDFHILKNKYFIAALSKPAEDQKRTAKTLRIFTRRAQTMHAKQINILVCRFLESLL